MLYLQGRLGVSIRSFRSVPTLTRLSFIRNVRPFSGQRETFDLPVGGNGRIKLNIIKPATVETSKNVLVYLPPGPSLFATQPRLSLESTLDSISEIHPSTSLVAIQYRLSPRTIDNDYRFPTPIHDVTSAWSFLKSDESPLKLEQDEHKICLLGSHIGGALAAMLALTEPNDFHASALIEPFVDWVMLDEIQAQSPSSSTSRRKKPKISADSQKAAAQELIHLRSKLFRTHSAYFDPFASPTLFLRAPGRDTPLTNLIHEEFDDLLLPKPDVYPEDRPDAFGPYDDDWPQPDGSKVSSDPEAEMKSPRRRKVVRRWPSVGRPESVLFPKTRVFVKPENVDSSSSMLLRAQGMELVDLMHRACFFGRDKAFAESRVGLEYLPDSENDPLAGMEAATLWLKQTYNDVD